MLSACHGPHKATAAVSRGRMKDANTPEGPAPSSRHERRVQRMQEHAARRLGDESGPRIRAGHRIFLHDRGMPLFGPGVYELLVLVDETGSLHRAAQTMGMSYSKAWRVTREAEGHLGVRLLERQAGGAAGGGSVLTEDGRQLVVRYGAFVEEADAELDRLYLKYFADAPYARPAVESPEDSGPRA